MESGELYTRREIPKKVNAYVCFSGTVKTEFLKEQSLTRYAAISPRATNVNNFRLLVGRTAPGKSSCPVTLDITVADFHRVGRVTVVSNHCRVPWITQGCRTNFTRRKESA